MVQVCALGLLLFDMPHSALNNSGKSLESNDENAIAVKAIQKGRETYPYVSAQAWRYWWRKTLEEKKGWELSPIQRDKKIAFTSADPWNYSDDDVFGYMRAEKNTLTRLSPLKCSPLMAVSPFRPTHDFGVMARHEGDPVPYESQFYSTVMQGAFSLDLTAVGSFLSVKRSGYHNIDDKMKDKYLSMGAHEINNMIEMPQEIRAKRASDTINALAYLSGGAKQTLFLTDVVPKLGLFVIFEGGNHPLMSVIYNKNNKPYFDINALQVATSEYGECLKSKVYIGKAPGFMDELDEELNKLIDNNNIFVMGTFKETLDKFANQVSSYYTQE